MKAMLQLALALAGCVAVSAWAQEHGPVEVSAEVRHDALPSLRQVVPQADGYQRWHARDEHRLPLPYTPPGQADGALQTSAPRRPAAPTFDSGVDGVGEGFSGPQGDFTVQYAPPDTVGAVGATQYVQVVNDGLAVFDKASKSVVYGPVPTNTLWSGFGGSCEADNDGDPVVVYDKAAGRWVVSQFAVAHKPYYQCVAVSQSSDATGGWYRYAFSYGTPFPDYPKMGVWPDAYYITFNMFRGNFVGAQLCAYDRAAMLAGNAATQQCVQLSASYGGVLPADLDGATPPPAGAPNYLVNFGSNSLNLWKFHVDWADSANTTLTGPANLPVAAFTPSCGGGSCIPQPGTTQKLDSLADRLMFRLAYRNFGDHEALVVNHTVQAGSGGDPYSGVRWYEIRSPGGTPVVFQQSTYAPDTNYRWMGSIGMDGHGDIAVGYSVASSSVKPAIRYSGRLPTDSPSALQAETSIIEGGGVQTGSSLDRWGDYSAMTIDPVDDCTFWYTTQYLKTDGAFNWSTRIASFAFPECGAAKTQQTVAFTSTAPVAAVYGGATYTVTAQASSGLAVVLSVDPAATAVCALDGTGSGSQVSFAGVGLCVIDADQPGDGSYNAAPQVQQSFAVAQATQSIAFTSTAPTDAAAGGSYTVFAEASSGLDVSLAIDAAAAGVCTIDGGASGATVAFIGVGSCIIDASQAGDANHSAAPPQQQSFDVGAGAPSLLVFTTQPQDVAQGSALGTIAVSERDAFGNVIDDSTNSVTFSLDTCGGLPLGSAPLDHGVAQLDVSRRLYLAPASYVVLATTGVVGGTSDSFSVQASAELVFASGFEACGF
jgi:hypothetical protein